MTKLVSFIGAIIFLMFTFSACVDADSTTQWDKMKRMGYYAYDLIESGSSYDYGNAETAHVFSIVNTEDKVSEIVYILYYTTDSDAMIFENKFIDDQYRLLQMTNPEGAADYEYKRIGKIFIHGTTDAVEDVFDIV